MRDKTVAERINEARQAIAKAKRAQANVKNTPEKRAVFSRVVEIFEEVERDLRFEAGQISVIVVDQEASDYQAAQTRVARAASARWRGKPLPPLTWRGRKI